jgi:hypothetical protein
VAKTSVLTSSRLCSDEKGERSLELA